MLTKKISQNPAINADRYVVCNYRVEEEIIMYWYTEYRDSEWKIIPDTMQKNFSFSTEGNMVDDKWLPLQMIEVPVLDEQENPTGQTIWERPKGAIKEITFLKNIPASMFSDVTIRWKIERLISMRIDRLDNAWRFD